MEKTEYRIEYVDGGVIESGLDAYLPIDGQGVAGWTPKIYNFIWNRLYNTDPNNPGHGWDVYSEGDIEDREQTLIDFIPKIGFFYGLLGTYDLEALGSVYPYMSFHNYQPGPNTKLGEWNLSIIGEEGLVVSYWKDYARIFERNRKFIIKPNIHFYDIKKHPFNRSTICRGSKFYVSCIKLQFPLDKNPIFECWEL